MAAFVSQSSLRRYLEQHLNQSFLEWTCSVHTHGDIQDHHSNAVACSAKSFPRSVWQTMDLKLGSEDYYDDIDLENSLNRTRQLRKGPCVLLSNDSSLIYA